MKKTLVLAPLLLVLGACGLDQPPPATEPDSSAEAKPSATAAPTQVARDTQGNADQKRLETFAARLTADGKGHFRFDRVRDAKKGGKERQVFVEIVGMTDVEAANAAAKVLHELGYSQGRRWGDENGVRISFTDKDKNKTPVRVLVRSREAHPLLKHDDSTSSVYLTRPVGE